MSLTKKHKLLTLAFLICLPVGIMFVTEKTGITNFIEKGVTDGPSNESFINLGPPTAEEKKAGDTQKEETTKAEERRNQSENQNKQTANVIITDAGLYDATVEVRAFIPDHYQDGTCTITFLKDGTKVEKSTPAYRDASTTVCTNPLFPRSEFKQSGEWRVTVTYTSEGAYGVSQQQSVTIN